MGQLKTQVMAMVINALKVYMVSSYVDSHPKHILSEMSDSQMAIWILHVTFALWYLVLHYQCT